VRQSKWLPVALWPVGIAAVAWGFALLFTTDGDVTPLAVVSRAVGGSFIACGLIAWQRRPDTRTGPLMTVTGFLFAIQAPLASADWSVAFTLGEITANWWLIPFTMLVLGFPSGRLTSTLDRLILAGFMLGGVILQIVWLFFLAFPPDGPQNAILLADDPGLADAIDTFQRGFNGSLGVLLGVVAVGRWWRAAAPLRRLLLPTLAGGVAALVLGVQAVESVVTGDWMRASAEITAVLLVAVPLAFLLGILRTQLARAGMADLVVALQQAPDAARLRGLLARSLGDPSLVLVYWLPGFECYVDTAGQPVVLPVEGSGRAATVIDRDGEPVAALVHDAALAYEPALLEVVCAATNVTLERERLQAELASRVEELAGSRKRLVEAGDAARRQIERDLHDGAQQRLVSLAIALRMTEDRIHDDPDTAASLVAAARQEVTESLAELRELARGIHPHVLEHGLEIALQSLATRSPTPVSLDIGLEERFPDHVELAAYFVASEGLANVGKYADASSATIRVARTTGGMVIEVVDDGCGGADNTSGSGLRGLADRVEALGGRLVVASPPGEGTVLTAELPCAVRPATR
jgi:signal transduction histidine kinase